MSFLNKTIKLGNIATIKGGKRLPKGKMLSSSKNSHPYIRIRDLTGKKFIELNDDFLYVDDETFQTISRYIVDEGDVLISIVGTIGLVSIVGKSLHKASLTENCVKIIGLHSDVINEYLYYYLSSEMGQFEIEKGTVGAVQPKLPISSIQNFDIKIPPIDIQKRIVEILGSVDEKIINNDLIISNLENQASLLFEDFYSKLGGEVVSFKDYKELGQLVMGQSPKGDTYNVDCVGMPLLNGAADYTEMQLTPLKYTTGPTRICKAGDLIFCIRATIGLLVYADKEYCLGRGVAAITKIDVAYKEFVYHVLNNTIDLLRNNASGSVIVGINKDDIFNIRIKKPTKDGIINFHNIQNPIFEEIRVLREQNKLLRELKQELIPKLLSGQIDLSKVKIEE